MTIDNILGLFINILLKLIKPALVVGLLFFLFLGWWFLTPSNVSSMEPYRYLVGKQYRTRIPIVIFDTVVLTTGAATSLYGEPSPDRLLPIGTTLLVKRVQAKPLNGALEYLSVITSSGPYAGQKVDSEDLWERVYHLDRYISGENHSVKTHYLEEVPTRPKKNSR